MYWYENLHDPMLFFLTCVVSDEAFWKSLVELLRSRGIFNVNVWKYATFHAEVHSVQELSEFLLSFRNARKYLEPMFYSPWLSFDNEVAYDLYFSKTRN